MNSFYLGLWQRRAVLVLACSLIGCGSSKAKTAAQSAPAPAAAATTTATAPAAAHGAPGSTAPLMPTSTPVTQMPTASPPGMAPPQTAMAQPMKNQPATPQPGMPQPGMTPQPASPSTAQSGAMPQAPVMGAAGSPAVPANKPPGMSPAAPITMNPSMAQAPGMSADRMSKGAAPAAGGPRRKPAITSVGVAANGGGAKPPAGSIEEVIFHFCSALADGDTAAASDYISPKAKGLLSEMREGTLSEDKIEDITGMMTPVSGLQPNGEPNGTKRSLRNGKDQTMSFTLKKEKDVYKLLEFTYPKMKKK